MKDTLAEKAHQAKETIVIGASSVTETIIEGATGAKETLMEGVSGAKETIAEAGESYPELGTGLQGVGLFSEFKLGSRKSSMVALGLALYETESVEQVMSSNRYRL